jgi:hypothetical protein
MEYSAICVIAACKYVAEEYRYINVNIVIAKQNIPYLCVFAVHVSADYRYIYVNYRIATCTIP